MLGLALIYFIAMPTLAADQSQWSELVFPDCESKFHVSNPEEFISVTAVTKTFGRYDPVPICDKYCLLSSESSHEDWDGPAKLLHLDDHEIIDSKIHQQMPERVANQRFSYFAQDSTGTLRLAPPYERPGGLPLRPEMLELKSPEGSNTFFVPPEFGDVFEAWGFLPSDLVYLVTNLFQLIILNPHTGAIMSVESLSDLLIGAGKSLPFSDIEFWTNSYRVRGGYLTFKVTFHTREKSVCRYAFLNLASKKMFLSPDYPGYNIKYLDYSPVTDRFYGTYHVSLTKVDGHILLSKFNHSGDTVYKFSTGLHARPVVSPDGRSLLLETIRMAGPNSRHYGMWRASAQVIDLVQEKVGPEYEWEGRNYPWVLGNQVSYLENGHWLVASVKSADGDGETKLTLSVVGPDGFRIIQTVSGDFKANDYLYLRRNHIILTSAYIGEDDPRGLIISLDPSLVRTPSGLPYASELKSLSSDSIYLDTIGDAVTILERANSATIALPDGKMGFDATVRWHISDDPTRALFLKMVRNFKPPGGRNDRPKILWHLGKLDEGKFVLQGRSGDILTMFRSLSRKSGDPGTLEIFSPLYDKIYDDEPESLGKLF